MSYDLPFISQKNTLTIKRVFKSVKIFTLYLILIVPLFLFVYRLFLLNDVK